MENFTVISDIITLLLADDGPMYTRIMISWNWQLLSKYNKKHITEPEFWHLHSPSDTTLAYSVVLLPVKHHIYVNVTNGRQMVHISAFIKWKYIQNLALYCRHVKPFVYGPCYITRIYRGTEDVWQVHIDHTMKWQTGHKSSQEKTQLQISMTYIVPNIP